MPAIEVAQLYEDARAELEIGARIRSFVGIFAIRHVRKMLRQRSREKPKAIYRAVHPGAPAHIPPHAFALSFMPIANPRKRPMSNDLAYTMLLIHQRQARDLRQQHQLQQLFLTFVGGEMSAEDYGRSLELTAPGRTLTAPGRTVTAPGRTLYAR